LKVGFARSANDVQVKRPWIFACQIKTGDAFPPLNQLQVEAMVWVVFDKNIARVASELW